MKIQDLTVAERAYLAGLIDGEGCIFIGQWTRPDRPVPQFALQVVIVQNNEAYLCHWRDRTGVGGVNPIRATRNRKRVTETLFGEDGTYIMNFQWRITDRDAGAVLHAAYEFMMIKRDQADVAFEFLATRNQPRGRHAVVPHYVISRRNQLREQLIRMHQGRDGSMPRLHGVEPQDAGGSLLLQPFLPLL